MNDRFLSFHFRKIHLDPDFKTMEEKQLRKKWQNMVHRYKVRIRITTTY